MLIFNTTYWDNFRIRRKAREWLKAAIVSDDDYTAIMKLHPSPYKSYNIFAVIGLFVFVQFILGSLIGMFNLLFMDAMRVDSTGFFTFQSFFFGVLIYIAAEMAVKKYNCYHTGIERGLLYAAVTGLATGIYMLINEIHSDADPLWNYIFLLPILLFAAIRFADYLLSLAAFMCLLMIDALLVLKMGTIGKLVLPFEAMAFSYGVYYFLGKQKNKSELRFWRGNMKLVQAAGIITFYLAGNYMVVRVLSEALLGTSIQPGEDIHLAFFFYAFTVLVPIAYVWYGLKKKDYVFLRVGLLLEVGGILAIKYYHHILPPETAMILGGFVTIAAAYMGIRYYKTDRNGITFKIYKRSGKEDLLTNIVSVAASAAVGAEYHAPQSDIEKYGGGGGQFGGGGAGADY